MRICRQQTDDILEKSGDALSNQLKSEEDDKIQVEKDSAKKLEEEEGKAAAQKEAAEKKEAEIRAAGEKGLQSPFFPLTFLLPLKYVIFSAS